MQELKRKLPKLPPPVLCGARVIAFLVVDEGVRWTGRQAHYVDGVKLGAVSRLALARSLGGDPDEILVFHCDESWEELAASAAESEEAAKAQVERAYAGSSAKWVQHPASDEDVAEWIQADHDHMSCHFCGRPYTKVTWLFQGKVALICGECVEKLHRMLHEDGEEPSR